MLFKDAFYLPTALVFALLASASLALATPRDQYPVPPIGLARQSAIERVELVPLETLDGIDLLCGRVSVRPFFTPVRRLANGALRDRTENCGNEQNTPALAFTVRSLNTRMSLQRAD
ncbi:MAG: hypothetical protein M1829_005177 [Trizodia sp. TS-e1964]|nr:MAG: hypothetical protein M1829_005177 [Trizodia sp. TS-e1964]